MPHLPLTAFFWPHPSSDRHTPQSGQQCRVGATTPDATDSASTLSTISSATHSSCAQVVPLVVPPQHFSYAPGGWGPVPNHYLAPVQLYPISYPPGPWPPYQKYYTGPQGHSEEDSATAKPDKF